MNSRLNWTKQEEQLLRELGSSQKKNKWTIIAKILNQKSTSFQRTPKQCRQKYNNHLIFGEDKLDISWTIDDDKLLFKLYEENGPKWKIISKNFPNKSQNTIKNKFYGNIRKIVRKLNKIGKQSIKKSLKPLRQKSFLRIIEPQSIVCQIPQKVMDNLKYLREKVLRLVQQELLEDNTQNQLCRAMEIEVIKQAHHFNSNYRFYFGKKTKNNITRKLNKQIFGQIDIIKNKENNSEHSTSQKNENSSNEYSEQQFESQQHNLKNQIQEDKHTYSTVNPQKNELNTQQKCQKKLDSSVVIEKLTFIQQIVQIVYEYCLQNDKSCLPLFTNRRIDNRS